MALAQGMLLIVVRHHAGDFAGATPNALLAVSHNKTIHNHTCFGSITFLFIRVWYLRITVRSGNVQMPEAPNYFQ